MIVVVGYATMASMLKGKMNNEPFPESIIMWFISLELPKFILIVSYFYSNLLRNFENS